MIIILKLEDDGNDGVFLMAGLLSIRLNGKYAGSMIIPDEFIQKPGVLALDPHQIDVHWDSVSIKKTIEEYVNYNNAIWREQINDKFADIKDHIDDANHLLDVDEYEDAKPNL